MNAALTWETVLEEVLGADDEDPLRRSDLIEIVGVREMFAALVSDWIEKLSASVGRLVACNSMADMVETADVGFR